MYLCFLYIYNFHQYFSVINNARTKITRHRKFVSKQNEVPERMHPRYYIKGKLTFIACMKR